MHDDVDTIAWGEVRAGALGSASPARLDGEVRTAVLPLLTARRELLTCAQGNEDRAGVLARIWRRAASPAIAEREHPSTTGASAAGSVSATWEAVDACFTDIAALEHQLAAMHRSAHRSRR